MRVRCPHCHLPIEVLDDVELSDVECSACGSSFNLVGDGKETESYEREVSMLGHFTLVRQLGVGAFGSVWQAKDSELDRKVAIKIPRKGQLTPSETEQFLREARSAAQLKHPNIVAVHEVGREDGQVYIVSDLIDGITLADRLEDGPLSVREAAKLVAKIAEAVHHAHEQGVVHRDLKPSNIMLDNDGRPHVMDFGLAKREAGEITMTVAGAILGTPAYMSPEQAQGEGHDADARSDVYSLGVILFECLTGELPFRGNKRMLLHKVINEDAPTPRSLDNTIPRDLETICLRCLDKDEAKRFQSAVDLASDLGQWLQGQPITSRPISVIERAIRSCRRNWQLTLATATAFLLVAIVTATVSKFWATLAESQQTISDMGESLAEQQGRGRVARKIAAMLDDDRLADERVLSPSERLAWFAQGLATLPYGNSMVTAVASEVKEDGTSLILAGGKSGVLKLFSRNGLSGRWNAFRDLRRAEGDTVVAISPMVEGGFYVVSRSGKLEFVTIGLYQKKPVPIYDGTANVIGEVGKRVILAAFALEPPRLYAIQDDSHLIVIRLDRPEQLTVGLKVPGKPLALDTDSQGLRVLALSQASDNRIRVTLLSGIRERVHPDKYFDSDLGVAAISSRGSEWSVGTPQGHWYRCSEASGWRESLELLNQESIATVGYSPPKLIEIGPDTLSIDERLWLVTGVGSLYSLNLSWRGERGQGLPLRLQDTLPDELNYFGNAGNIATVVSRGPLPAFGLMDGTIKAGFGFNESIDIDAGRMETIEGAIR